MPALLERSRLAVCGVPACVPIRSSLVHALLSTRQSKHNEEKRTMARQGKKQKNETPEPANNGNGLMALVKELWQAAVNLRGSIEPADYKRYVLPIIFLRFLSLRYEKRRAELEKLIADPKSDYYTDKPKVAAKILEQPDEYRSAGAFIVPEKARWDHIVKQAQDDDIKVQLDESLELLEKTYP